jgi:hypothetical protein
MSRRSGKVEHSHHLACDAGGPDYGQHSVLPVRPTSQHKKGVGAHTAARGEQVAGQGRAVRGRFVEPYPRARVHAGTGGCLRLCRLIVVDPHIENIVGGPLRLSGRGYNQPFVAVQLREPAVNVSRLIV